MAERPSGKTQPARDQLPDEQAREHAVNPAASCIIQAPAGSGKTTLLATRFLRLLTTVDEPEEILAITFTKKAAAEMRHRILTLLTGQDQLAALVRARDAANEWQLIDNPHRLKIQTIDSFALELASRSPLGGLSRGMRIEEDASYWYAQAAQRLLTRLYVDHATNPIIADFFAFLDNDFDKASRLVTSMLGTRDQWLSTALLVVTNSNASQDALVTALDRAIQALRQRAEARLEELFTPQDHIELNRVADAFNTAATLNDVLPLLMTKSRRLRKQVTVKDGIADVQLRRELSVWLKSCHERGIADDIASFCRLPPIDAVSLHHDELNLVAYGLALAAAELESLLRNNGVLDFTGLLIHAKRAMVDHGGVTELGLFLDYRIRHILIDEFQDTSRSQIEFFEQLVEGWEAEDGRTFFAVGDPMQSIYRFRDADVAIFAECQRTGLGGVSLDDRTLLANFRSSPVLIEWTNSLFAQLFGDTDAVDLGQVRHSPALAVRDRQPQDELHCLQFANATRENHEIVTHIKTLLAREPDTSIAILCKARTHISDLLIELDRAELTWHATDMTHLGERPVVTDLMSLYGVLLDPLELLHWFAVLRSPMFGLTLTELTALADTGDRPIQDALATSKDPRVQRFSHALANAQRNLYEVPLTEVLEVFWLRCGGLDAYPASEIPNARAWFDLLDQLGSQAYQSTSVARGISSLFANSSSIHSATESKIRLQVMTIHKAKGLEFDHVIVPCLHRRSRGDDPQLLRWRASAHGLLMGVQDDPIASWLKFEEAQRSENEEKRLLYVACTRAAHSLWLSYTHEESGASTRASTPTGLARWLVQVARDATPEPGIRQSEQRLIRPDQRQVDLFATTAQPMLSGLPEDYQWQPAQPPPLPRAKALPEPEPDLIGERLEVILGNLIHQALAWLAGRSDLAADPVAAQAAIIPRLPLFIPLANVDGEMNSTGADDALILDQSRVLQLAQQQIADCLRDPTLHWILKPRATAYAEYPITTATNDEITRVVIDRLFVDGETVWVIDYKTSSPADINAIASFIERETHRYRAQLSQYQQVVTHLLGKPVRTALYFTALQHFEELL